MAEAELRRVMRSPGQRGRRKRSSRAPEMSPEILDALTEMRAACEELDSTVGGICKRHDPLGCLPPVLAVTTAGVIAVVAARSLRWYFVTLLSVGGAALMLLVLMVFRIVSWSRNHPLLVKMFKLRHISGDTADADDDMLELAEAIVAHYLPGHQSGPILARLASAKERAALFGLPEPDHHASSERGHRASSGGASAPGRR